MYKRFVIYDNHRIVHTVKLYRMYGSDFDGNHKLFLICSL